MKIAVGAVLACGLAAQVAAQETSNDVPVNAQFGSWIVACEAVTVNTNICRLVQEQVLVDTNQLIARFIVQPADDDAAIMLAQVPIAVFLAGGAVYRLEGDDEGPQREMVWQRCAGSLCEAALFLEPEELAAMETAGGLLFGYRTGPETDPIITRVDLTDFLAGLNALR